MSPKVRLWLVILAGIPLVLLGGMMLGGSLLESTHEASSRAEYPVPPDSLWAVITDFAAAPSWRPEVLRMERLPDREGRPVWVEVGRSGSLPFEIVEWDPPRRLTTRIADPELPFGGSWIYSLEATGTGSRLLLIERGEIKNPVFRFLARFVFGYHSTMDGYLRALGLRFSSPVMPEHGDAGRSEGGPVEGAGGMMPRPGTDQLRGLGV